MPRPPERYAWKRQLASHFHGLAPALVGFLALWSLGILLARRCGLSWVVCHLAPLPGPSDNTVRQRLREFYQEAPAKAGRGRKDFDPPDCCAPLLAWVLSVWPSRPVAVALDVTNVGERFHVPCVSVVYSGIGIPVAWKVLRGNQPEAWHPHWCRLLGRLRAGLAGDGTAIVRTDRGLESPRLFGAIVAEGWPTRRPSSRWRVRCWAVGRPDTTSRGRCGRTCRPRRRARCGTGSGRGSSSSSR